MRIASVSDIHTDYASNRKLFSKMVEQIGASKADAVIVAGDVSHIDTLIVHCIVSLRQIADIVAYLPGNHDLWVDRPGEDVRDDPSFDTWDRHDRVLRKLVEAAGGHYLPAEPLRLGDVAIAGACGWYDHSFFRSEFRAQVPESALHEQALNGMQWGDRMRTAFRRPDGRVMTDPEVARVMEDALAAQLTELENDPQIEHVICATHHQQYEQTVRRAGVLPWEFFNAFMGAQRMGDTIDRYAKVGHVIYGHTHTLGDRQLGTRRVFGTPLGYPRERAGVSEAEILRTRIGWIEL